MDALMAIDDELDEEEVDDEEIERIDQDNSIVEVPNSVMTEEIVFGSTSVASLESSNEDVIIAPLKADEASFVEVAEDEAKEILPATVEENSMNLDDLVINGTVSANIDNEGDDGGYDFSDDDDELADIEQFLMKS
jgi:phosphosulfolactate phosphohydrolase-like enzyme